MKRTDFVFIYHPSSSPQAASAFRCTVSRDQSSTGGNRIPPERDQLIRMWFTPLTTGLGVIRASSGIRRGATERKQGRKA